VKLGSKYQFAVEAKAFRGIIIVFAYLLKVFDLNSGGSYEVG